MILYETINTQRISGRILVDELYSPEMPASMPLRNAYSPERGKYPSKGTNHFPCPCLAFDDEDDEDEDIGDDFDDLDDDFDDDFEDDDFDDEDDFEDAFEDEDFEDAFEDEDFDE